VRLDFARAESCEERRKRRRSILFFPEKVGIFVKNQTQMTKININYKYNALLLCSHSHFKKHK
jgi:hypothetical protein